MVGHQRGKAKHETRDELTLRVTVLRILNESPRSVHVYKGGRSENNYRKV